MTQTEYTDRLTPLPDAAELRALFDTGSGEAIRALQDGLNRRSAYTVAEYVTTLEPEVQAVVFRLLAKDKAADVFTFLDAEATQTLLSHLTPETAHDVLQHLEADDLVDWLEEMPANFVTRALRVFDRARRSALNELLNYPEESVGAYMTVDYLHVHDDVTAGEALEAVRTSALTTDLLNFVYVTGASRRYRGTVPLWRLVRAAGETPITELADAEELTLETHQDQEEAALVFQRAGVAALPVVDLEARMVGIVTADDMMHVLRDEADEDYSLIQGVTPSERTYLETPAWLMARQRLMWLLVLLLSAVATGFVIQRYEGVLAASVALTAYIPMLMDSGGNSGSQSSTLITRSIAMGELSLRDTPTILWKEVRIGVYVGVPLALINLARIYWVDGELFAVSLTVSIALCLTIIIGKLIGGVLPLVAKRLGADPAVMAGPFVTTIVDTLALMIYFNVAQLLL